MESIRLVFFIASHTSPDFDVTSKLSPRAQEKCCYWYNICKYVLYILYISNCTLSVQYCIRTKSTTFAACRLVQYSVTYCTCIPANLWMFNLGRKWEPLSRPRGWSPPELTMEQSGSNSVSSYNNRSDSPTFEWLRLRWSIAVRWKDRWHGLGSWHIAE